MASLEGGIGAVATSSGQAAELLIFTALAGARRPHRRQRRPLRRHPHPARRDAAPPRRRHHVRRRRRPGRLRRGHAARRRRRSTPRSIANPSGVGRRPGGAGRRGPRPRRPAGGRRHPGHARTCAGRSSTAPTSWCTRPPSSSAATAPRIGGVVVERGRFRLGQRALPADDRAGGRPTAGCACWGNFAEYGFCTRLRAEQLRDFGACLAPFNAFLFLQGLETLPLRMDAHVANARAVAELPGRPPGRGVGSLRRAGRSRRATSWPGATSRRARARCSPSGCAAAATPARGLHRARRAGQPPGQRRRRPHPRHPPGLAPPTSSCADEALVGAGVGPDLVRISVGIEDVDDIIWDLDQALSRKAAEGPR